MGIFDIFKRGNAIENERTVNFNDNEFNGMNPKLIELFSLIEKNAYVDDRKTEVLFEKAYQLTKDDIIGRHFLYNRLIDYYYGLREQQENALNLCKKYCYESIDHTPVFLQKEKQKHNFYNKNRDTSIDYVAPQIPAFKRLAIILENEQNYTEALKICNLALNLKLRDGTKSGFEGRKVKLLKKQAK